MPNTRKDKHEVAAAKAVKALQASLFESGLNELEAMTVLRIVTSNLEQVLKDFIDSPPRKLP